MTLDLVFQHPAMWAKPISCSGGNQPFIKPEWSNHLTGTAPLEGTIRHLELRRLIKFKDLLARTHRSAAQVHPVYPRSSEDIG